MDRTFPFGTRALGQVLPDSLAPILSVFLMITAHHVSSLSVPSVF